MATALKITTIGNSVGIVLPNELRSHMNVQKGDTRYDVALDHRWRHRLGLSCFRACDRNRYRVGEVTNSIESEWRNNGKLRGREGVPVTPCR
jgi:hypothetical protein